jgi:hypothetical protein
MKRRGVTLAFSRSGAFDGFFFCLIILACSLSRIRRRTFFLTVSPPLAAQWRHVASFLLPSTQAFPKALSTVLTYALGYSLRELWASSSCIIVQAVRVHTQL